MKIFILTASAVLFSLVNAANANRGQDKHAVRCIVDHVACVPDSPDARKHASMEFAVTTQSCYDEYASCELLKDGKCGWRFKNAGEFKNCVSRVEQAEKKLEQGN